MKKIPWFLNDRKIRWFPTDPKSIQINKSQALGYIASCTMSKKILTQPLVNTCNKFQTSFQTVDEGSLYSDDS